MGFILSCATTPQRIGKLIHIIPHLSGYKYFVINVCQEYKRFGKFKIPKELLQLCKKNKKVVFQFVDDYGPVCKYIGGFRFMKKKKIIKTNSNITTGSGFDYDEKFNYKIVEGKTDMVEGYGGICFGYDQYNEFIEWFVGFYKHFIFKNDILIDKYLSASFLGDDFILSNLYNHKHAIQSGRQYIQPYSYGFEDDALHKNNVFGSNMGSYKFLNDEIMILNTFKLKYILNKSINKL